MKKRQTIKFLRRVLSYGLIICLMAGLTDVFSLSVNAEEVVQEEGVELENPDEENTAEEQTGEEDAPDIEVEDGSDIVAEDEPDVAVEDVPDSEEEGITTEDDPSEVVYDPQPTSPQEVEDIINGFQEAWEEAMATGGDLDAVLATKPHWQYEVAVEWMPSGYRCEKVEDDAEFGSEYYTFFMGIMPAANYYISDFTTLKTTIESASASTSLDIEITAGFNFTDTITVPAGVTINLHSTSGSSYVLLQTAAVRHFAVYGKLTLQDITLDGGSATSGVQGGIYVYRNGSITIEDGTLVQNCCAYAPDVNESSSTQPVGGGIKLQGGARMIMNGGTISNNTAKFSGGGVGVGNENQSAVFTMNGGRISNNNAGPVSTGLGGGFGTSVGGKEINFTLNGGEISNNSSSFAGGGVFIYKGSFTMTAGTISGNTSVYYGGGIDFGRINTNGGDYGEGNISLTGGTISDNTVSGTTSYSEGGGICAGYAESSTTTYTMHIDGTIIKNNNARNGAGIYKGGGALDIVMDSGEISNNVATNNGGGIFSSGSGLNGGHFIMNDGAIVSNKASNGGGIAITPRSYEKIMIMNGGSISQNTATSLGGGIYMLGTTWYGVSFEISGGEINGNKVSSTTYGAGIYWGATSDSATGSISGCTISNNTIKYQSSYNGGAGIYTANKTYANLEVGDDVIFSGNRVGTNGYYQPVWNIATLYPNIRYAKTSFDGTGVLQTEHALNNYDINYRPYKITYNPNGGTGTVYSELVDPNSTYTVLSNANSNLNYADNGNAFNGWNTVNDGSGTPYAEGVQFNPSADIILYAQWTTGGTLTVSNTVTGKYGNMDKRFEVNILLKDGSSAPVSRTISYTGSSTASGVTAPANGSLTFDAGGSASISLKHGQAITLAALPVGYQYQVIEPSAPSTGYIVTYNGVTSSTGFSDTMGSSDVTVAVEHARDTIPATGVLEGGSGTSALLISGTAVLAVTMLCSLYFKKRGAGRK
ncbi:MAG TPA: InlB B-repeat-containing protein [Candidatus Pelethocola excrementipullorum]|nr:InlB B-repeat-containing protein [Candidatus Pelethocola excrementipullorum]